MPRIESKFATVYGDPCLEFRSMRNRYCGTQKEWAEVIGVNPSVLSRIENGQEFPSREVLLEWTGKLGLDSADEDDLLISAAYLPRLPEGFGSGKGTRRDHYLLTGALRELIGRTSVEGFMSLLRNHLAGIT